MAFTGTRHGVVAFKDVVGSRDIGFGEPRVADSNEVVEVALDGYGVRGTAVDDQE